MQKYVASWKGLYMCKYICISSILLLYDFFSFNFTLKSHICMYEKLCANCIEISIVYITWHKDKSWYILIPEQDMWEQMCQTSKTGDVNYTPISRLYVWTANKSNGYWCFPMHYPCMKFHYVPCQLCIHGADHLASVSLPKWQKMIILFTSKH